MRVAIENKQSRRSNITLRVITLVLVIPIIYSLWEVSKQSLLVGSIMTFCIGLFYKLVWSFPNFINLTFSRYKLSIDNDTIQIVKSENTIVSFKANDVLQIVIKGTDGFLKLEIINIDSKLSFGLFAYKNALLNFLIPEKGLKNDLEELNKTLKRNPMLYSKCDVSSQCWCK